mgnify:CR=1 FL=1
MRYKILILLFLSLLIINCSNERIVSVTFMSASDDVFEVKNLKRGACLESIPYLIDGGSQTFFSWVDKSGKEYGPASVVMSDVVLYPNYIDTDEIIKTPMNILFFGDSIGAGVGWILSDSKYPTNFSFPFTKYGDYCKQHFSGGLAFLLSDRFSQVNIFNLSVGGAHFSTEIDEGPYYYEELDYLIESYNNMNIDIVCVETTFNDYDSIKIGKTSVQTVLLDFRGFLRKIKKTFPNAKIMVMNSADGRYQEIKDDNLSIDLVELLNGFEEQCELEAVPYFDIRKEANFSSKYGSNWFKDLFPDGIHINEVGYRKILFPLFLSFLARNIN